MTAPGISNPALRFPAGLATSVLERYFLSLGIRFVILEIKSHGEPDLAGLMMMRRSRSPVIRKVGDFGSYLRVSLDRLAARGRVLYRDERMLIFEIGRGSDATHGRAGAGNEAVQPPRVCLPRAAANACYGGRLAQRRTLGALWLLLPSLCLALASAPASAQVIRQLIDAKGDGTARDPGPAGDRVRCQGQRLRRGHDERQRLPDPSDGKIELVIDANGDGRGHKLTRPTRHRRRPEGQRLRRGRRELERLPDHARRQEEADRRSHRRWRGQRGAAALGPHARSPGQPLHREREQQQRAEADARRKADAGDREGRRRRGSAAAPADRAGDGWKDNLYVAGAKTRNVFKVEPSGKKTQIVDGKGAGEGKALLFPNSLAVDAQGNVFVGATTAGTCFGSRRPARFARSW